MSSDVVYRAECKYGGCRWMFRHIDRSEVEEQADAHEDLLDHTVGRVEKEDERSLHTDTEQP